MWDLKLTHVLTLVSALEIENRFNFAIFTELDPILNNTCFALDCLFQNLSFFTAIKFLLAIAFLILIRGGTPRYRYDYLTKLGWLKFLSLTLYLFICALLFIFLN